MRRSVTIWIIVLYVSADAHCIRSSPVLKLHYVCIMFNVVLYN